MLATTINDSEDPFDHSPRDEEPPASEFGEPLPAPLATREQGEVMDTIWRLENLVTPQKGQGSQTLKQYWGEFMARFRHYANPLDESRTLLVICHVDRTQLLRQHTVRELFAMMLSDRAFSVWRVDSSDERGILLFEKHPMCHAETGWGSFTMRENALPDIALTSMSDWQQAQTLMVNQYRKYFVNQPNVPFKGNVYPADLVTKTALLEKEVSRQK